LTGLFKLAALFALIFAEWHFFRRSLFLTSDFTVPGIVFLIAVCGLYLLFGQHRKRPK
jgi:hypothetical protein